MISSNKIDFGVMSDDNKEEDKNNTLKLGEMKEYLKNIGIDLSYKPVPGKSLGEGKFGLVLPAINKKGEEVALKVITNFVDQL
jgi:hypothetical protein